MSEQKSRPVLYTMVSITIVYLCIVMGHTCAATNTLKRIEDKLDKIIPIEEVVELP